MANTPKRVGILSDLHCGPLLGLLSPHDTGHKQNIGQKYLWECWRWVFKPLDRLDDEVDRDSAAGSEGGVAVWLNEIDRYAVAWLRELIATGELADGVVDERDIKEVAPADVEGQAQCHFFAGIGGWPYALRLAGWPVDAPVWTGSCPCQRFSSAARGKNNADDLWPEWYRLISACRPPVIFGEQVAHARDWFDGVCDDMEALDYAVWAAVLPACSVGADHVRYRIYYACYTDSNRQPVMSVNAKTPGLPGGYCASRHISEEDGLPRSLAQVRAYGNAIVPQVAAAFVRAFMEADTLSNTTKGGGRV